MGSPAFTSGLPIPAQFSCDGQNISPALEWTEPPAAAKSLVLILDDPDAPGRTWNHWLVFNIPPSSRGFAEAVPTNDQLEDGSVQGITSAGSHGYQGPCPPSGTHRYFFKLYALDITLPLDSNATKDDVEKAMDGHILASTEFMGTFSR
jgi:Raf kinase inhibitor-like YbhB/YbcL family protein